MGYKMPHGTQDRLRKRAGIPAVVIVSSPEMALPLNM